MAYRLDKTEYLLPATELAPALLGKFLCRNIEDEIIRLRITETECYYGEIDTACHAHKGKTPRTETLYRQGGCAYVYVCYGIHSMLNVV
ncbi:MAG TPA: 3-methyladenine DNA glycosylase, partial [Clostridiales bacterium]|nr:3-methyladenine DNA glycosylase [Clostridiales bacterium]